MNDQAFETEYETTDADTCSQLPPQNVSLDSSSDTLQTLPGNPGKTHHDLLEAQLNHHWQDAAN